MLALANIYCLYAQEIPKADVNRSASKIASKVIETVRSSGTARVMASLNGQIKTSENLDRTREKRSQRKLGRLKIPC